MSPLHYKRQPAVGPRPDHFLNTQMDNLVLWKRAQNAKEAHELLPRLDPPVPLISQKRNMLRGVPHGLHGLHCSGRVLRGKAECYLMSSQVPYTIIHPGGLLPHYGDKTPAPGDAGNCFLEWTTCLPRVFSFSQERLKNHLAVVVKTHGIPFWGR